MTRSAIASCLGALLLFVSGFTSASTYGPPRLFEAQLTITANLTPESDPCYIINREVGAAISRQLGNLTWNDIEVVSFCSVAGGVSVVAQFSLTATDNSRIFGKFDTSGSITPEGGLEIAGQFQFESGTGRFEGIRGSGSLTAAAPPIGSPDPVLGQMRGWYQLPR